MSRLTVIPSRESRLPLTRFIAFRTIFFFYFSRRTINFVKYMHDASCFILFNSRPLSTTRYNLVRFLLRSPRRRYLSSIRFTRAQWTIFFALLSFECHMSPRGLERTMSNHRRRRHRRRSVHIYSPRTLTARGVIGQRDVSVAHGFWM